MQTETFKKWLRTEYVQRNGQRLSPGTQTSRLANCSTVEQVEGDLDNHFLYDEMQVLMDRLTFTADDVREHRQPKHRIPIDGDIANGTGTYRAAINLYRKFLVAQRCSSPTIEETIEDRKVVRRIRASNLAQTEKEALIKSRVGQGIFRYLVLETWDYRCAVTGVGILLTASHIKPWRVCSNRERLDAFNGLSLSPVFDQAFDAGLITFRDSGEIVLSPRLVRTDANLLGLSNGLRIQNITEYHAAYLDYHRTNVWKP